MCAQWGCLHVQHIFCSLLTLGSLAHAKPDAETMDDKARRPNPRLRGELCDYFIHDNLSHTPELFSIPGA
jgi:hypothetical protein